MPDINALDDLVTPAAAGEDGIVTYDYSKPEEGRITEIKFSGNASQYFSGAGTWLTAFDGAYGSLSGAPAIPVSGTDFDPAGTDNSNDHATNNQYSGLVSFDSASSTRLANTQGNNNGDQDLSGLAPKANVIEKDSTAEFTPTADYHPANKKYVDDNSGGTSSTSITRNATAANDFVAGTVGFLSTAGTVTLADADAEASTKPMLVMATTTITGGNSGVFERRGKVTVTAHGFSASIGLPLFLSQTAGGITLTAPGSGTFVRSIGYALDANTIDFQPSEVWVEVQ